MKRSGALHPMHHSRLAKMPRWKPKGMIRDKYPDDETREIVEQIALDIFTDCINAGLTFQVTLASILNSGMHFAVEAAKETPPHD